MSVLNHNTLLSYLHERMGPPGSRNGMRQKISRVLRCHPTHLSQLLKGNSRLSLEHAVELSEFFVHDEVEKDYFITLVCIENAGSVKLQNYYRSRALHMQKSLVAAVSESVSSFV